MENRSSHKRPTISGKFERHLEGLKRSRITEIAGKTKDHTIQRTCKFQTRSKDGSRFRGVSKNGSKWKVSVSSRLFILFLVFPRYKLLTPPERDMSETLILKNLQAAIMTSSRLSFGDKK